MIGFQSWFGATWLLLASLPLTAGVKIEVREGRPFVNGVHVNGHGPYRFLIDTGTSMNLIETGLARKIGMNATFEEMVESSLGTSRMPGSDGNLVEVGSVRSGNQRFQFSKLDSLHSVWPDVQGVLGQWFLAGFDYTLNLRARILEFGKQETAGKRTPFRLHDGRTTLATSLGDLVVDSGAARLVLFGVGPGAGEQMPMLTLTGLQNVGTVARRLIIEGRDVWRGNAVALPDRSEPGVAGLMPLSMFKSVYICNSESYVVLE